MKNIKMSLLAILFTCAALPIECMSSSATSNPSPDSSMPPAGYEIIEILNHPEKYEQPDFILVMGEPASNKTMICKSILASINASPLIWNAYDLIKYYKSFPDEQTINESVQKHLILRTIAKAKEQKKPRAALVILNFDELYRRRNEKPIRDLLNALDPSKHENQFLIICESLPLDSNIKGENVIHGVMQPTLAAPAEPQIETPILSAIQPADPGHLSSAPQAHTSGIIASTSNVKVAISAQQQASMPLLQKSTPSAKKLRTSLVAIGRSRKDYCTIA